jgi:hypothetical protein
MCRRDVDVDDDDDDDDDDAVVRRLLVVDNDAAGRCWRNRSKLCESGDADVRRTLEGGGPGIKKAATAACCCCCWHTKLQLTAKSNAAAAAVDTG